MLNLIELPIERTIDRSLEDKLIRATTHAYLAPFLGTGRAALTAMAESRVNRKAA